MKYIWILFAINGFSEIDFSSLVYDYSGMPELSKYQARDKSMLDYRYYPSSSKNLIIILHGSGYHSRYLYKLAQNLNGMAQIVTPDLRGHGANAKNRGDVDYIGQLDDDLDDLVEHCHKKYRPEKIYIAGHSSGGGLALRLMGNDQRPQAEGYILLAPYLAHDAPTTNAGSNWAKPKIMKIILANVLNGFGLSWLDHSFIIEFNLPKKYRDGSETLAYTHAFINSYAPKDYQKDLLKTARKTLVLVGEDDEAMHAHEYKKLLPQMSLKILSKINHMGIVTNVETAHIIGRWLVI